jgi:hypothetical protein
MVNESTVVPVPPDRLAGAAPEQQLRQACAELERLRAGHRRDGTAVAEVWFRG